MGIIVGLIGASIVANAISETVVGKQREKEQAKVQTERIRAEKEIKTAKIYSKAVVKTAKINARADVAQTGMKTGFFTSLFGINSGPQMLNDGNVGWAPVNTTSYIPQSTTSYLPQQGSCNRVETGSYYQQETIISDVKPMFCRYCGTKQDDDAIFCVRCGRSLD